jgi:uncharacterized protein
MSAASFISETSALPIRYSATVPKTIHLNTPQKVPTMRLSPIEQRLIQDSIAAIDPDAEIYLFGSRVDDEARGGDIDLLVLSNRIDFMAKLDLLARLHRRLGEQKIDLMIEPDTSRPLARIAVETGIRL